MARVLCACRRAHYFVMRVGVVQVEPCECKRVVTFEAKPPTRWSLLEID
jgi:hypothetical protein